MCASERVCVFERECCRTMRRVPSGRRAHTLPLTHSFCLTQIHTHSLSFTLKHSLEDHADTDFAFLSLYLSLSDTHTISLSLCLSLKHSLEDHAENAFI